MTRGRLTRTRGPKVTDPLSVRMSHAEIVLADASARAIGITRTEAMRLGVVLISTFIQVAQRDPGAPQDPAELRRAVFQKLGIGEDQPS
jgi:hypothetical protein